MLLLCGLCCVACMSVHTRVEKPADLLDLMQLYPDMGVAAMLRNDWKDRDFEIAAISERNAVVEGDDLVVIAAVDPQGMR